MAFTLLSVLFSPGKQLGGSHSVATAKANVFQKKKLNYDGKEIS